MKYAGLGLVAALGCGTGPSGGGDAHGVTIIASVAPDAIIVYRDGDGPWTATTGAASPIKFPVETGTYTVAVGCPSKDTKRVDVYELTTADLQTVTYDQDCRSAVASVGGTVSGFAQSGPGQTGFQIRWGQDTVWYQNFGGPASYTAMIPLGTHDLVATRGTSIADRLMFIRDLVLVSSITQDFDFADPNAVVLEYPQISAIGIGRLGTIANTLFTSGGTKISLGIGTDHVSVVPAAAMGQADLQMLSAAGQVGVGSTLPVYSTRHVSRVAPTMIELPPPIQEEPIVVASIVGSSTLLEASWSPQPNAAAYGLHAGNWSVHASPAVLESSGMSLPDLATVPGWDATLSLQPSISVDWDVTVATGATLDDTLRTFPIHETEIRNSGWVGRAIPQ